MGGRKANRRARGRSAALAVLLTMAAGTAMAGEAASAPDRLGPYSYVCLTDKGKVLRRYGPIWKQRGPDGWTYVMEDGLTFIGRTGDHLSCAWVPYEDPATAAAMQAVPARTGGIEVPGHKPAAPAVGAGMPADDGPVASGGPSGSIEGVRVSPGGVWVELAEAPTVVAAAHVWAELSARLPMLKELVPMIDPRNPGQPRSPQVLRTVVPDAIQAQALCRAVGAQCRITGGAAG